ncbi:MAG: hypothetical protein R3A10_09620 [Caldilineaceae bacterium]
MTPSGRCSHWPASTLDLPAAYPGRSYAPLLQGPLKLVGRHPLRRIRRPAHDPHAHVETGVALPHRRSPRSLQSCADPGETVNLAADPAHAARLADLKAALDQFFATHDTPAKSGLNVKQIPRHNLDAGNLARRPPQARGLQPRSSSEVAR